MEGVGAEQADQGTDQQATERRDALVGRLFQSDARARWTCSTSTWATASACTARWPTAARRPRPSWRRGPASTSGTPGSGWSSRPSPACWTWTTRQDAAASAATRCPRGHDEVLLDRDSLSYLAYVGRFARRASGRRRPGCWRRSAPAAASPGRRSARTPARARPSRTGRSSSNLLGSEWLPAGPRRPRPARAPTRPPGWPTSAAAPAGRASPSRRRTRRPASTASTWTSLRSSWPGRTPPSTAWPTG